MRKSVRQRFADLDVAPYVLPFPLSKEYHETTKPPNQRIETDATASLEPPSLPPQGRHATRWNGLPRPRPSKSLRQSSQMRKTVEPNHGLDITVSHSRPHYHPLWDRTGPLVQSETDTTAHPQKQTICVGLQEPVALPDKLESAMDTRALPPIATTNPNRTHPRGYGIYPATP